MMPDLAEHQIRKMSGMDALRREPGLVEELQRLRDEAECLSLTTAPPAIDEVLKAA